MYPFPPGRLPCSQGGIWGNPPRRASGAHSCGLAWPLRHLPRNCITGTPTGFGGLAGQLFTAFVYRRALGHVHAALARWQAVVRRRHEARPETKFRRLCVGGVPRKGVTGFAGGRYRRWWYVAPGLRGGHGLGRNRRRGGICATGGDLADDGRAPMPGAYAETTRKERILQWIPLPVARNMPQALVGGVGMFAHSDRVQVIIRPARRDHGHVTLSLDPWNSLRGGRRVNSENAF